MRNLFIVLRTLFIMKKRVGLLLFFILVGSLHPFTVSAINFSVSDVKLSDPSQVIYQGDSPTLTARVTASSDNICDIQCTYSINVAPYSSGTVAGGAAIPKTQYKDFEFNVQTQGIAVVNYIITVTCDNYNPYCLASQVTHPLSGSLPFLYAGDGVCTTSREKCANYGSFTGTSDCSCPAQKKCYPDGRPDVQRGADDHGCATFCGNGIAEKQFESCSTCPSDVGKCNGISCISGSECEGRYCIHQVCWDKPWKEGDGFCDLQSGENCKNSVQDCACGTNQRCGATAVCETYCGNRICEESEKGICKSDCKWCGDGECSGNEDCNTCQTDCGVCENKEVNQQIASKTQEIVKESITSTRKKQKLITFSALGVIALLIVGYLIFKFMQGKKQKVKKEESSTKESKEEPTKVPERRSKNKPKKSKKKKKR